MFALQTKPFEKPLKSSLKSTSTFSTNTNQPQSNQQQKVRMADHQDEASSTDGGKKMTETVTQTPSTQTTTTTQNGGYQFNRQAIRSNYMDKSIEAKKKVQETDNNHVYE